MTYISFILFSSLTGKPQLWLTFNHYD